MKYIFYISLLLISFQGIAQKFADKSYYLVDSLVLEELSKSDKQIVDSYLKSYHNAKSDTSKINAIIGICDNMMHEDWKKYNNWLYQFIRQQLKTPHSLNITKKLNRSFSEVLNNTGLMSKQKGNIPKALEFYNKSYKISLKNGNKQGIANSLNNIAEIYRNQGNVHKALEYHTKSLEISEKTGNKQGTAYSYNNIALIYGNQGDLPKAIEYFTKSLKIREDIGDKYGMANSFSNISAMYDQLASIIKLKQEINRRDSLLNKALVYQIKSLNIRMKIGDKHGMGYSLGTIGNIYEKKASIASEHKEFVKRDSLLKKALTFYNKSLTIREEIGDKQGIALSLNYLGVMYQKQNNFVQFQQYAVKGYELSKELGFPDNIKRAAHLMKELSIKQGNYKKAFEYYKEENTMIDSIQNDENYKKIQKQQAKYEYEKQAVVDSISNAKAMDIKNIELAQAEKVKEKQQIIIYSFVAGFVLVLFFTIVLLRMFEQKKKANQLLNRQNAEITFQKEELSLQRNQIEKQHDIVLEQKKDIDDSIEYAKRIQTAVLPTDTFMQNLFEDYFIFFKPKDVVSGDFYWATQTKEFIILTVADCTGHSVPGAFMSMLGVSFLNEIVRKEEVTNAAEILNNMRDAIIDALQQTGKQGEQKDGMDMSVIAINKDKKQIMWAGANNPLWIIRQEDTSTIEEIKGDKMPVAIHAFMDKFKNHELQLKKGDSIFLFSDGYADQFGGSKGKKFMSKAFKNLLLETSNLPMQEQGKELENTLTKWMTDFGKNYEQIDDICVIGVKI